MAKIIPVTLNPNDMGAGFTLNNGNLTLVSAASLQGIRATHGKTMGKWYWEVKLDSGNIGCHIGVANRQFPLTISITDVNWRSYYGGSARIYPDNLAYGSTWAVGNIIGIALDMDNGTLEFYKNGVGMGVSHTNLKELGEVYPLLTSATTTSKTVSINFGAASFVYGLPQGYQPYNVEISNKFLISSEDTLMSFEDIGYVNMIPKMTSNTSASPVVPIYSGEFINGPATGQGYAYQAFDDNTGTSACPTAATTPLHLGIDFFNPVRIDKYSITASSAGGGNLPATSWVFEASNDKTTWEILDTQTSVTWAVNITKEFIVSNATEYRYYRMRPTINGTFFYADMKMMKYMSPTLNYLSENTESVFVKYGNDKNHSIDMWAEMNKKSFVSKQNVILGSGKVFKQKIDTSKIPIKKVSIT